MDTCLEANMEVYGVCNYSGYIRGIRQKYCNHHHPKGPKGTEKPQQKHHHEQEDFYDTRSAFHHEAQAQQALSPKPSCPNNWVAVKELKLSYYIGEILLFTIYTHYGN